MRNDISEDIFESFIITVKFDKDKVLKKLIEKHSDFRGFFPVELVGTQLKEQTDKESEMSITRWIDSFFYGGFNTNRFKLIAHEQGQPRHGRGLLDKNDFQLIKIKF